MGKARFIKKSSLTRRLDAFFTANPGEGLSLTDACAKFSCTPKQFAVAMKEANHALGLGLGVEPFYRLGVSVWAEKRRVPAESVGIRPGAVSSSIFSGNPQRVRLPAASPVDMALLSVRRDGGSVVVVRMMEHETEGWKEREAARRARQKPPKPSGAAKTRSKKLLELVGEPHDE